MYIICNSVILILTLWICFTVSNLDWLELEKFWVSQESYQLKTISNRDKTYPKS